MKTSKARALFLLSTVLVSAGCTAPDENGIEYRNQRAALSNFLVGVNYNAQTWNYRQDEVDELFAGGTSAPQVRAIINVLQLFTQWQNGEAWQNDGQITRLCNKLSPTNVTTVNLRYDYKMYYSADPSHRLPRPVEEAAEWADIMQFTGLLIERIRDCTDVLVVGNEPFLETQERDWTRLVTFYIELARKVKTVWTLANGDVKPNLFLGSFEALWVRNNDHQCAGEVHGQDLHREDLLQFVRNHSGWITGVDLHLHHRNIDQVDTALNWVDSRLLSGQQIIITEFSPSFYYMEQMDEPLNATFKNSHSDAAVRGFTQVHQYLDWALIHQDTWAQYNDFFAKHSAFTSQANYLCQVHDKFRSNPKFRRSFTGINQGVPDGSGYKPFHPDEKLRDGLPWFLNPIYVSATVELLQDGSPQKRPQGYFQEFRNLWLNNAQCP
jgi:hypothetical protein